MASLMPEGRQRFFNNEGRPLAGGKVYTYQAGTVTPKPTYPDAAETSENPNPVILDARGEATIFWDGAYKVKLCDENDVEIWTVDDAQSPTAVVVTGPTGSLIVPSGTTAQRDNPALMGYFRHNISFEKLEYYTGARWNQVPNVRDLVSNDLIRLTTTGTSTAYVITPRAESVITGYVAGQAFEVTFHVASGAAPTLRIDPLVPTLALVKQAPDGTYIAIGINDIPANHVSRVVLLSDTQALVERFPFPNVVTPPTDWNSFETRI